MTELIIKAYDVLDELTNLEVFIALKNLNILIEEKYKIEIKAFQDIQKTFNEIMNTGGKYHPDYKKTAQLFSNHKKALYDKEEMIKYRELEKAYEKLLNEFLDSMTKIISPHIKTKGDFFKGGSKYVCQ